MKFLDKVINIATPCLSALCLSIAPSPVFSQYLDNDVCQLISRYDSRADHPSFIEQFLHIAHTREACIQPNGRFDTNCPTKLSRWAGPFTIVGQHTADIIAEDQKYIYNSNVQYMSFILRELTGYNVDFSAQPVAGPAITIYIVDELGAAKVRTRVRHKALLDWLVSQKYPTCAGASIINRDNEIMRAEIFISASINNKNLANCIKEEIVECFRIV